VYGNPCCPCIERVDSKRAIWAVNEAPIMTNGDPHVYSNPDTINFGVGKEGAMYSRFNHTPCCALWCPLSYAFPKNAPLLSRSLWTTIHFDCILIGSHFYLRRLHFLQSHYSAITVTYYLQFSSFWGYMRNSIRLQICGLCNIYVCGIYSSCNSEGITSTDGTFDGKTRKTPYHQPSNKEETYNGCSNIHIF